MSDNAKRRIIRFLNSFDRVSAKSLPAKGWNANTITRDESAWRREAQDELERMNGKELNRELRQQILYSLPSALFLLLLLAAIVWIFKCI